MSAISQDERLMQKPELMSQKSDLMSQKSDEISTKTSPINNKEPEPEVVEGVEVQKLSVIKETFEETEIDEKLNQILNE